MAKDERTRLADVVAGLLLDYPALAPVLLVALVGGGAANYRAATADVSDRIHRTTVVEWREADKQARQAEKAQLQGQIAALAARIASVERYRIEHTQHASVYTEKIENLERSINPKPHAEVNSELRDQRRRIQDLEKAVIKLSK